LARIGFNVDLADAGGCMGSSSMRRQRGSLPRPQERYVWRNAHAGKLWNFVQSILNSYIPGHGEHCRDSIPRIFPMES
jgi:hypothetical protein